MRGMAIALVKWLSGVLFFLSACEPANECVVGRVGNVKILDTDVQRLRARLAPAPAGPSAVELMLDCQVAFQEQTAETRLATPEEALQSYHQFWRDVRRDTGAAPERWAELGASRMRGLREKHRASAGPCVLAPR